ncbi:MAG: hypothetical protein IPH78_11100 [Bacteroidetes bacterium]|nr:hypothetical protein [Bacteroidota bacterium]
MAEWYTTPSNFFTRTVVPVLLMTLTPPFALMMWYTNAHLDGSLLQLGTEIMGAACGACWKWCGFRDSLAAPLPGL